MAPRKIEKRNHGLIQKCHFWDYTPKNRKQGNEQTLCGYVHSQTAEGAQVSTGG